MATSIADEGTGCYLCSSCGKGCDLSSTTPSPTSDNFSIEFGDGERIDLDSTRMSLILDFAYRLNPNAGAFTLAKAQGRAEALEEVKRMEVSLYTGGRDSDLINLGFTRARRDIIEYLESKQKV